MLTARAVLHYNPVIKDKGAYERSAEQTYRKGCVFLGLYISIYRYIYIFL